MVKLVVQAIENHSKLMKELCVLLGKILACKQEIVALVPRLESSLERMKQSERTLTALQEKRQKDIWSLLKIAMSKNRQSPPTGSPVLGPWSSISSLTVPTGTTQTISPPECWPKTYCGNGGESMLLVAEGQKQISLSMELIQNLQDQSSDLQSLDWSWLKNSLAAHN
uniref:IKBKB scaffold dimerization domain-containing protein n=1 Tax=Eptatretus burgeri TaxID=7764 RepID=A0A8C4Q6X7_EPTBU